MVRSLVFSRRNQLKLLSLIVLIAGEANISLVIGITLRLLWTSQETLGRQLFLIENLLVVDL